jgi:hypothetical protein
MTIVSTSGVTIDRRGLAAVLHKMKLRLSKSHVRQTKCQIRIDYNWDGEEANFADSALTLLRGGCFHVVSF